MGEDGEFDTSHWFQVLDAASSELELKLALSIGQPYASPTVMTCRHLLWATLARGSLICDNHDGEPLKVTNTGPGFNRGSGGGARGCGFEERVGVHARTRWVQFT